jgi:carbon storage regulator
MLVLSRHRDERIIINGGTPDEVVILLVDIRGDKARIGITAPRRISVNRAEIQEEIDRERRAGAPAPRCVDCGGALAAGRSPGYCRDCDEYHRWIEGRSDGR